MPKKPNNDEIAHWNTDRQAARLEFIKEIVKARQARHFSSLNAFAVYIAQRLHEHEMIIAKHLYEINLKEDKNATFKEPRPIARQTITTNPLYAPIVEAAWHGKKIEGTRSIKTPKTIAEFNAVVTQKDFEISNLKDDIEKLKAKLKVLTSISNTKPIEAIADESLEQCKKEKSLTTQALIKVLKWNKGLLDYKNGEIIDIGNMNSVLVERMYLSHCAKAIDNALSGFTPNE